MIEAIVCLATAIFFEARNEEVDAQRMVAEVVMNRVEDTRYPDSVCDVVFEDRAFSFTHDGKSDDMQNYDSYHDSLAMQVSMVIAKEVYERESAMITSTHYHTTGVSPFWASSFTLDGKYGSHIFYTNETPYK